MASEWKTVRVRADQLERAKVYAEAKGTNATALVGSLLEAAMLSECPKATCSRSGPFGEACPAHPHLKFKQ